MSKRISILKNRLTKMNQHKYQERVHSAIPLFILTILFAIISHSGISQDVTATLKPDSSNIIIGDFLNVTLSVNHLKEFNVIMPPVRDTLGNMEVVKVSKTDTSVTGNSITLSRTYTVSAYDSGKYHVGPAIIFYKNANGVTDSILTEVKFIDVATVAVDTSKPVKSIKAPLDVPYALNEFIPLAAGTLGVLAIITGVIYFIRRRMRKQKKVVPARPKPQDPPHVWATKELKKLEDERLWQKGETKSYYSRLSDILRLYLEYRFGWFALESTTEEISEKIHSYDIAEEPKHELLQLLTTSDLVKFARMTTSPDTNLKVMESAYKFIELTAKQEVKMEEKTYA